MVGSARDSSDDREVRTGDASLVGEVQSQGTVAEESSRSRKSRGVVVGIGCFEGVGGDGAVFAREVTHLTGLGELGIARRSLEWMSDVSIGVKLNGTHLAAFERVDMAKRSSAVAVAGHGCFMEVIDWKTCQDHPFTILKEDIRNGPPLVGRLEKLTSKATPTPLGVEAPETWPLTLPCGSLGSKNSLVGRTAT